MRVSLCCSNSGAWPPTHHCHRVTAVYLSHHQSHGPRTAMYDNGLAKCHPCAPRSCYGYWDNTPPPPPHTLPVSTHLLSLLPLTDLHPALVPILSGVDYSDEVRHGQIGCHRVTRKSVNCDQYHGNNSTCPQYKYLDMTVVALFRLIVSFFFFLFSILFFFLSSFCLFLSSFFLSFSSFVPYRI